MSLGYGSPIKLPELSKQEVTRIYFETPRSLSFWERFGGWILTALEVGSMFIPVVGETISAGIATTQAGLATKQMVDEGKVNAGQLAMLWGASAVSLGVAGKGIVKGFQTGSELSKAGLSIVRAPKEGTSLSNLDELLANVKDFTPGKFVTPKQLSRYKDLLSSGRGIGYFRDSFGNMIKSYGSEQYSGLYKEVLGIGTKGGIVASEITDAVYDAQRSVQRVLSEAEYIEFEILISNAGKWSTTKFRWRLGKFIKKLSVGKQTALKTFSKELLNSNSIKKLFLTAGRQETNVLKMANSSKIYQNEVQWIQNINGSDMGRFIAEKGYHKIKNKIDDFIEKSGIYKWFKKVTKGLKTEAEAEELFIKTGGVRLQSKYLWGYKILQSTGTGHWQTHEVLIKFNKLSTSSRTGKNKGGKKDIIIRATTQDLERLVAEGSSYWFAHGAAKGWFMSKGGRAIDNSISNGISTVLSFLPIQFIRSFGSMISNIKDVSRSFASRGFLGFFKNYGEEVAKNFKNTGINRVGRLLARSVVGKVGGRWAGRATQQVITAGSNALFKDANFKAALFGTKKSQFANSLIGKRFTSDLKYGVFSSTGKRATALTAGRKLQISKSAAGWGSGW